MISVRGIKMRSVTPALFWIFIAGYIGLILVYPRLGPSDEYAFLPTLQSGKHFPMYGEDFPYYDVAAMGRFAPLAGQEYNLAAAISNTPQAYFLLNAIQLVIFVFAFLSIISRLSIPRGQGYVALVLLLLLPVSTLTFYKLLYIDKTVLTLMAVALAAHIRFQTATTRGSFLVSILTANLALYYREPVFALLATYATAHWWLGRHTLSRGAKVLDAVWIASAAIYLLVYLIWVMPHRGAQIYGQGQVGDAMLIFVKNAANYAFFSDPIIILCVFPLALYRIIVVLGKRAAPHPIIDAMLLAGVAYAGVFIVLNIFSPYYMLPVYLFTLPALLYFYATPLREKRFWRWTAGITGFVLLVNTIPLGIHYLSYNKYVPINFDATIAFLKVDISRRYQQGKRASIFFDGVDRGTGKGIYFVAGEYLKFKGLPIHEFDLKSNVEALQQAPFVGKPSPFDTKAELTLVDPTHSYVYPDFPFAVFQPGPLPTPQRGDYLIVSPHSTRNVDQHYLDALGKDYDLVFRTYSRFAVPRITLKTALKFFLTKTATHDMSASGVMLNENLLNWPDYYVFVKK